MHKEGGHLLAGWKRLINLLEPKLKEMSELSPFWFSSLSMLYQEAKLFS